MIVVPGELAQIGRFTVQVAEMYLRNGNTAEVTTTDGRTFTAPFESVRHRDETPGRGRTVNFVGPHEETLAGVRPGFVMVHGREPHAGERVWLTRDACYQVYVDGWWLVERVEAAYVPEFSYLHAVRAGDPRRACQRLYAAVYRLHVERADPGVGRPDLAGYRGPSAGRQSDIRERRPAAFLLPR